MDRAGQIQDRVLRDCARSAATTRPMTAAEATIVDVLARPPLRRRLASARRSRAIRRAVPGSTSAGSASTSNQPHSAISRLGSNSQLPAELAPDIDRDMVALAAGDAVVVETEQLRPAVHRVAGLLHRLARRRRLGRLARLDPAARKLPARHIGVPDQQHLVARRSARRGRPRVSRLLHARHETDAAAVRNRCQGVSLHVVAHGADASSRARRAK